MRKKIGIDFDDVLYPTHEDMLEEFNSTLQKGEKKLYLEDINTWNLDEINPRLKETFAKLSWEKEPKPGVKEAIEKMHEKHELFIITASHPLDFAKKEAWIKKHLPLIDKSNIILARNKSVVAVDVMVDDGPHNLKEMNTMKLLVDMPHNLNETHYMRVNGLLDAYERIIKHL